MLQDVSICWNNLQLFVLDQPRMMEAISEGTSQPCSAASTLHGKCQVQVPVWFFLQVEPALTKQIKLSWSRVVHLTRSIGVLAKAWRGTQGALKLPHRARCGNSFWKLALEWLRFEKEPRRHGHLLRQMQRTNGNFVLEVNMFASPLWLTPLTVGRLCWKKRGRGGFGVEVSAR